MHGMVEEQSFFAENLLGSLHYFVDHEANACDDSPDNSGNRHCILAASLISNVSTMHEYFMDENYRGH
jgi:hypothetical protein